MASTGLDGVEVQDRLVDRHRQVVLHLEGEGSLQVGGSHRGQLDLADDDPLVGDTEDDLLVAELGGCPELAHGGRDGRAVEDLAVADGTLRERRPGRTSRGSHHPCRTTARPRGHRRCRCRDRWRLQPRHVPFSRGPVRAVLSLIGANGAALSVGDADELRCGDRPDRTRRVRLPGVSAGRRTRRYVSAIGSPTNTAEPRADEHVRPVGDPRLAAGPTGDHQHGAGQTTDAGSRGRARPPRAPSRGRPGTCPSTPASLTSPKPMPARVDERQHEVEGVEGGARDRHRAAALRARPRAAPPHRAAPPRRRSWAARSRSAAGRTSMSMRASAIEMAAR